MLLLNTPDDQARAIQKLLNEMGWNTDPHLIRQRILELNNGLVQEDEFIYILNWMKNVELIHKLEQFQIPPSAKKQFTIPDLFIVRNQEGERQAFYIEIKTSKKDSLKWTEKYYQGLKNYSIVTGIPILVAWKWKKFDIWTLFRLEDFEQTEPGGSYKIDLSTAHKRSLLSDFFRDYYMVLPDETALIIKHRKVEKKTTEDGEFWETIIESIYWTDRNGNAVNMHNNGIMALFFCLQVEDTISEDDNYLYYKFTPSPNKSCFAQSIPILLTEAFAEHQVNWLEKIQNQEFPVSYNTLLADLTKACEDGTLDYIFFTKPNYN